MENFYLALRGCAKTKKMAVYLVRSGQESVFENILSTSPLFAILSKIRSSDFGVFSSDFGVITSNSDVITSDFGVITSDFDVQRYDFCLSILRGKKASSE
ncbi:MAG TPA: hypothetical protein VK612_12515 [Pyrinomonadaceae bacterium]|nr:hypothetical protein [Pyrinomonadaceae bacterium]